MPIALYALASHLPARSEHNSLLGSVVRTAYNHLYHPAGNFSRPPLARRGVMRIQCPAYSTTTAPDHERTADLASNAVGKMLANLSPSAQAAVGAVFHNQCTLDQQIVGSVCLRIQDDHFDKASLAMMIGQLGTAGIPSVFRLAELSLEPGRLTCISASDKWMAPFVRCVPGLLVHGDASAACLAGEVRADTTPVAVVESVITSCVPPAEDMWRASAESQRRYLLDHARRVVGAVLDRHPDLDRESLVLIGDGYGNAFAGELAASCGIESVPNSCPDLHLSSASPLFAISRAVELAVERGQVQHAVIWTVSQAGHAGAMLVRASPDALHGDGAWHTSNLSMFNNEFASA